MTTPWNVTSAYRRSYPQTSKAVGRARRDIVDFAKSCGFSGQTLSDIEVAAGEGLANAVEHGLRDEGSFLVFVRRDAAALVIEIKDSGRGFDPANLSSGGCPPADALRGFGLFIMRELMDEIDYADSGTRLRLVKRLPPATARERSVAHARSS